MSALTELFVTAIERPFFTLLWTSAIAFVVRVLYRGYQQRKFYRNLPGPPHSWLWGHLQVMGEIAALMPPNCHPQAYYTEIARKYNLEGIFYIDVWPIAPGTVVLSDPGLLEQVTVLKPLPQHPLAEEVLSPMVGHNVIAVTNGPLWKSLHNAMAPAFTWAHIRSLTGLIVDECIEFRKTLDKLCETGEVFSVEHQTAKLVFDVIARVVFNYPLNAQLQGSQDLEDLREMIDLAEGAMDIMIAYNPIAQIRIWWRRRQVLGRLHPSMINKLYERFNLLLGEKVIPSRRDPTSILDLMLREHVQARTGEDKSQKVDAKIPQDQEQILLSNIKGLLLGGHGTTTDGVCFIYMLLSKAPHVVEKMCEEHMEVLGRDMESTMNELVEAPQKLQTLPYTEAVIKEALRLFPVGFGVREGAPGSTLNFKGADYPIDNHLVIATNGHDLHYNPKYFPDPTKFQPERWLGETEIPRSHFRTFGRGLRGCLGQNLAMNELKIILIMTVRDYTFECVGLKPNAEPKTAFTNLDTVYGDIVFQELGLEAKPRGGMMMTVKKRV